VRILVEIVVLEKGVGHFERKLLGEWGSPINDSWRQKTRVLGLSRDKWTDFEDLYDVFSRKDVSLEGFVDITLHLRVQGPKNPKGGSNRYFQAKRAKY